MCQREINESLKTFSQHTATPTHHKSLSVQVGEEGKEAGMDGKNRSEVMMIIKKKGKRQDL